MKLKAMMQKDGVRAPVALISQRALLNTEVKKSSSYSFTRRKDCIAAAVLIDSGRKQLCPLCFWPAAPAYASGRRRFSYIPRARTPVSPESTVARRQGPTKPLKWIRTYRRLSTSQSLPNHP
ncbi:hypothetical protein ACFX15_027718 [Malus domestica]